MEKIIRRKRSITTSAIYIIFGIVAIVLVAVLFMVYYWYTNNITGFRPGETTYQAWGGMKIPYSADTIFYSDENGISIMDSKMELDSTGTPLLYDSESKKMTMVEDMLLMVPSEGTGLKKIMTFFTLTETGGRVTYTKGKNAADSYGGFLYDGEDTYVFLEDTTLVIGNNTINLGPLSYAVVGYDQYVEYYNSADQKIENIGIDGVDVIATAASGYRIDLNMDSFSYKEIEGILYSNVENINPIETIKVK